MEELKLGLDLLTVIAATIAFFVGLWQYQRAQLWKRLEFVAAEITAFNSDWRARNAMLMLDWGSRKLALFPEETSAERREVFVDRKLLSSALLTHDKVTRLFTDQEAAIRDCFDAFLGYFDRFDQFVEAGLVQVADFKPYLQYWIETLNTELDPAIQLLLSQYIAFYRFDAADRLLVKLGAYLPESETAASDSSHRHQAKNRYEEEVVQHGTAPKLTSSAPT